jgi:hypothetical protein
MRSFLHGRIGDADLAPERETQTRDGAYSEFLRGGPVESEDGVAFVRRAMSRLGNQNDTGET